MVSVNLNLSYPQLSQLLQQEINKQNIVVKGYEIFVRELAMKAENGKIRISGKIDSKWDAYFDFSAVPLFRGDENKIYLEDLELDLDATNLIFKGILKLARGNVKNRIEQAIENPLDAQLIALKSLLDQEIANAPLPHNLNLNPTTDAIRIKKIEALTEHLSVSAEVDLVLNISFKEETDVVS